MLYYAANLHKRSEKEATETHIFDRSLSRYMCRNVSLECEYIPPCGLKVNISNAAEQDIFQITSNPFFGKKILKLV